MPGLTKGTSGLNARVGATERPNRAQTICRQPSTCHVATLPITRAMRVIRRVILSDHAERGRSAAGARDTRMGHRRCGPAVGCNASVRRLVGYSLGPYRQADSVTKPRKHRLSPSRGRRQNSLRSVFLVPKFVAEYEVEYFP